MKSSRFLQSFPSAARALLLAAVAALVTIVVLAPMGRAQLPVAPVFRQFTNKEGRTIDAHIVSMSPDRRTMKIRMRDGKELEMVIVLLSLDDQQHVKEWLAQQPATVAASPYQLKVDIEKITAKAAERERGESYRYTREFPAYRLRIQNVGRETVPTPTVEYVVLVKNVTHFYRDGGELYSGEPDSSDTSARTVGSEKLANLEFNRDQSITTGHVAVDSVVGDGNTPIESDKLQGILVRILDAQGKEIGLWRSQDLGVAEMDWETAVTQAEPEDGVGGMLRRRSIEVAQGEKYRGERLDITDRPFSVNARILPDKSSPNGIIASHGAHLSGWALMVKNGKLTFLVRLDESTVKEISADLPEAADDPYQVEAQLTPRSMVLKIEGREPIIAESPGLIGKNPVEALSVGYEDERTLALDYEAPFKFAGTIEDFAIWLPRGQAGQ